LVTIGRAQQMVGNMYDAFVIQSYPKKPGLGPQVSEAGCQVPKM